MNPDTNLLNFSTRLFRQILKVYPRHHQDRFKDEMMQDFHDLSVEVLREHGLSGFLKLWMGVGLDILKTAFIEHFKILVHPALERLVYLGAFSAMLAGVISIMTGFTHASQAWIHWVFRMKWVWFSYGALSFLAILGFVAIRTLSERKNGIGLWLSILGAGFMTIIGVLIPSNIRIWRIFGNGVDILAIGLLVQAMTDLQTKTTSRLNFFPFVLGIFMLAFNQLTPPRHLGQLFEGDGTLFACLTGGSWVAFGISLFYSYPRILSVNPKKENQK